VCQKSDSCGGPTIEVEETAEPLASNNPTVGVRGLGLGLDQLVLEPLVIPLLVVVSDKFRDRPPEMALA
jgi:hypothetical protein